MATFSGFDDAADDQACATAAGKAFVLQQRGDRPFRDALDDPDASRDRPRVLLVRVEPVVIGLAGIGNVGVAELDHVAGDGARRRLRTVHRHGDRVPGFHAESEANRHHFISSLTSSNCIAWPVNAP